MAEGGVSVGKRVAQVLGLTGLFLASFVVFLYLTFPYEVLKESLAAELSQSTGYMIRIGDMSTKLPLGIRAEDIRVEAPRSGATLSVSGLSVRLGILGLFMGKVATETVITSGTGEIEVGVEFSIFDLIGQNFVPKRFRLEADAFPLDGLVAFGLKNAASAPGANQLLAPLLSVIGLSAQLTGKADFKLDTKTPTQSTGQAELAFTKAVLKLSDPSIGLPDQVFKKAMLKAKVDSGSVVFDKNSGFLSEELELGIDGKIKLNQLPLASQLDMKVVFKLHKGLKEKLGWAMTAVTSNPSAEGELTMQVRGALEQPAVTTF